MIRYSRKKESANQGRSPNLREEALMNSSGPTLPDRERGAKLLLHQFKSRLAQVRGFRQSSS
jgi:hypothetical protein